MELQDPVLHASDHVTEDQLSAFLRSLRIQTVIAGGFARSGPWLNRAPLGDHVKLIALAAGHARLRANEADPLELTAGDVAVVHTKSWLQLESWRIDRSEPPVDVVGSVDTSSELRRANQATDDIVIGGHLEFDSAGLSMLRLALPPVTCLRSASGGAIGATRALQCLLDELQNPRAGSAYAISGYARLLVLELIRTSIRPDTGPAGWLRLLGDENLRPAVMAMHGQPGRAWRVADLAQIALMSRTSFAMNFSAVSGISPLSYLLRLRMLLAQQLLRETEAAIDEIAHDLGYTSSSAFGSAFKRFSGVAPTEFRRQSRTAECATRSALP